MFADNMRNVANSLINKFGSDIELVEIIQGIMNPDTGMPDVQFHSYHIKAHVSPYEANQIEKDVIDINDIRVLIYADVFDISKKWVLKYDGQGYEIINMNRTTAQNKRIVYELQCRGRNV